MHIIFTYNVLSGSNGYKSGFNGMEKENELYGEGNAYTTMFRLYDARLGSWKSSDPLQNYFAPYSPYNFVFNNPIFWIDPEGLSPKKPGERNIFQKIFGRTSTGLKLVEPEKVTEVITYTKRNYLKPGGMLTEQNAGQSINELHVFNYSYNKTISHVGVRFNTTASGAEVLRQRLFSDDLKTVFKPDQDRFMPLQLNRRLLYPISKNNIYVSYNYTYPVFPEYTEQPSYDIGNNTTITYNISVSATYIPPLFYQRQVKITATQKYIDSLRKQGYIE